MKKIENLLGIVIAVIVVIGLILLIPKQNGSKTQNAGGGISLKGDSKTTITGSLEASTGTNHSMAQAIMFADYHKNYNNFYIGSTFLGGVASDFGVCTIDLYSYAGIDIKNFSVEYRVGNFGRNGLKTSFLDPDFANFTPKEKNSASNAMQLSSTFKQTNTSLSIGHQGVTNFYTFSDGCYYIAMSQKLGNLSLSGGVDFWQNGTQTGYAAAQWADKNNVATITANSIGHKTNEGYMASFTRKNIAIKKELFSVTGVLYSFSSLFEQGGHLAMGWHKGAFQTFAQLGIKTGATATPYMGVSTRFVF